MGARIPAAKLNCGHIKQSLLNFKRFAKKNKLFKQKN